MTSTELCTPAAFIRNVLFRTKCLSCAEAPKVKFAVCSQHSYCGSVDNIEFQMNSSSFGSLGYAVRSIQRDALQLLREDLMQNFDIPGGLVETILSFPDNISAKQPEYFFGNHQKSARLMSGWASSFAVHLKTGANPIIRNVNAEASCAFQAGEKAGEWLAKVEKLSNLLYVLVHICGGGPPRLTEMNSVRFRNTSARQRNLFLYKRCLCIMVSYSKTNLQFQKATPIARFLDASTTQLLLFLIVFIKPVQSFLLRSMFGKEPATSDYLFCKEGVVTNEKILSSVFRGVLSSKGVPFSVLQYRHYRTGIVKAFMTEFAQSNGDIIAFKQAGHSEGTAISRYASVEFDFDHFNSATTEGFFNVSRRWHALLGLLLSKECEGATFISAVAMVKGKVREKNKVDNAALRNASHDGWKRVMVQPPTATNDIESSANDSTACCRASQVTCNAVAETLSNPVTTTSLKRCNSDVFNHAASRTLKRAVRPRIDVMNSVSQILGISGGTVTFKSEAQKAATFECTMQGMIPGYEMSVLIVLPTGGGKTLCWAAPALREQEESRRECKPVLVTILVVPLISLQRDMLRRCKSSGLTAVLWESRFETNATVVICAVDKVIGMQYADFVKAYFKQGRLVRIVIDEVHLVLLWKSFRDFSTIRTRLRPDGIKMPLVMTTSTAPPLMIRQLKKCVGATDSCFKLIRTTTGRPNVSHSVQQAKSLLESDIVRTCAALLYSELSAISGSEKVIAYCLTIRDAEAVATCLKGLTNKPNVHLYVGTMSVGERMENFRSWSDNESIYPQAMIATSAFSCGIDYPAIRYVLHVGGCRNMVEFAQETGRAGRDGKPSKSLVVYNTNYCNRRTMKHERNRNPAQSMNENNSFISEASVVTLSEYDCFGSFHAFSSTRKDCRRAILESFIDGSNRGPCQGSEERFDVCLEFESAENPMCETVKERILPVIISPSSSCEMFSYPRDQMRSVSPAYPLRKRSMPIAEARFGDELISCKHQNKNTASDVEWKLGQLSRLQCSICVASGIALSSGVGHEQCTRGRCFRCMERGSRHQSRDCNVTPRGSKGAMRCFFCGIPKSKDLHSPGTFNIKGKCQWVIVKNLALLAWRNLVHRRTLYLHAPILRDAGDNVLQYGRLLCGGEDHCQSVWLRDLVTPLFNMYVLNKN